MANEELFLAAARDDAAGIDAFLCSHPDFDVNEGLSITDSSSALHIAAAAGHSAACRTLIGWGASALVVNKLGETPLHLCAAGGHFVALTFLLASVCKNCERAKRLAEVSSPELRSAATFRLLNEPATPSLRMDILNSEVSST